MQNVVISKFEVESEAYQAFSMLKADPVSHSCRISQVSLVRFEDGEYKVKDAFDDGRYVNDTWTGGLLGMLIGILGGPIGVLLGGGIGFLAGSAKDTRDADKDRSLVESVISDVSSNCMFLAILADETEPAMLNSKLSAFSQTTTRYDAAELMAELEEAKDLEKEMSRKARAELRDKKREAHRERVESYRDKLRKGE